MFTMEGAAGPLTETLSPGGEGAAAQTERVIAVPEGIFPGYPEEAREHPEGLRLDPARTDATHPLARKFAGAEVAAARFRRTFRFRELDATAVPFRYADGSPALLERAFGAGRVLVFTSAADADGGDLMLTGATAALPLQAVYHASGRGRNDALNLRVGDDIRLRFGFERLDREVRIRRPSGALTRVTARATRQGNECVAVLEDAREPGRYAFEVSGGAGEREVVRGEVAVSFDAAESDRTELDPAEIAQALPHVTVSVEAEDLLAGTAPFGADGWLVLVLAAVALLCVEGLLANRRLAR